MKDSNDLNSIAERGICVRIRPSRCARILDGEPLTTKRERHFGRKTVRKGIRRSFDRLVSGYLIIIIIQLINPSA